MSRAASWINPVLSRELTERMRGPRAMVMLSAYLGVLGLVLVVVYRSESDLGSNRYGSPLSELAAAGETIFEWMLLFTMLLVLFLVPGFTAGSVAGERERQTLMPMQVSLLRPLSIVLGKIGASVAFTLLLVLATLPLLTVAYLIGGVAFPQIVKGLGMVMFTAVGLAAISVACSTFMRRVQTATVLSYGLVLLLCVGTFAVFGVAQELGRRQNFDKDDTPRLILAPNPVAALADVTTDTPDDFGGEFGLDPFYRDISGPLSGIREMLEPDIVGDHVVNDLFFEVDGPAGVAGFASANANLAAEAGGPPGLGGPPFWAQHMLIMGALVVLSAIMSSLRLRTPAKTER